MTGELLAGAARHSLEPPLDSPLVGFVRQTHDATGSGEWGLETHTDECRVSLDIQARITDPTIDSKSDYPILLTHLDPRLASFGRDCFGHPALDQDRPTGRSDREITNFRCITPSAFTTRMSSRVESDSLTDPDDEGGTCSVRPERVRYPGWG